MKNSIERISRRDETQMIPEYVADKKGLVTVDITWGKIQPIQAAEGVQTVSELEVIDHIEKERPIVDVRVPGTRFGKSIPGSVSIPLNEFSDRLDELDRSRPTIFFCNGPQCPQSQKAINYLLDKGYPADKLRYYRGGMHNWITLGLPVLKDNE
ncbi:MAG: rhodanese-like domain-containing protein [Gracilimonas sp.]|uniref:rhodanese-like domain-containing protein n=1 Tax=Gracilimonas sp. TaxID=1974203 RepID=UPI0037536D8E|nr:rhodanese-like domain-containing protein [Gracilimonas sp.]